ncbi:beta-glucosidase D [Drepanopeziza brunnea f. sp. 'multigermtubi' MB_m1]|uniref:beta-glucosidase n=1 Tax=Marssonina brunnea f. sp. multigermtubi (strain MB_m1) TaxID=1072389 RepID=K1WX17_MARBU|nr:beta-glucosidase D [Drepanopeziza brunnea f. sp. 'multigermtubi' MB_m1]EKD17082.1 beta-glucosidase D [Drepanopeziza brunnea f. sp. 'multigermtubi' MB_m1]
MRSTIVSLLALALVRFGAGVRGDASTNYTDALLSSGTVKLGDWQEAFDKAHSYVQTLTTAEKVSIITGGGARNFSAIIRLNSATSPLKHSYVTTWPGGSSMAMTWDKDAMEAQGRELGLEFRGKGVQMVLAPSLEPLGRSAWGGRTGESYGADSFLNGAMGGLFVKGVGSAGIIPSSKHFILNEQETNRMFKLLPGTTLPVKKRSLSELAVSRRQTTSTTSTNSPSTDADKDISGYTVTIDDKAFHETYLQPFYDATKNGVAGTMCAMNSVNGSHACENQVLLGKYLKVELGMPGIVHADVGGQRTAFNAANAGLDYGEPVLWTNATIVAGLTNGSLTMERLDDMVIRGMMGYFHYKQDEAFPAEVGYFDYVDVRGDHAQRARSYAASSIVLLKNTNNALPLRDRRSVSIFGTHAAPRYVGANTALIVVEGVGPTMSGHMTTIGGTAMAMAADYLVSCQGSLAYVTTPFQKFVERAEKDGFMLRWWLNDTTTTRVDYLTGQLGSELVESTLGVAAGSDVCVCFLNAWSGEGADRLELANAEQDTLVKTVADNCNNQALNVQRTEFSRAGPRLVDQWISHPNVTGVIYGGPLGQESGNAIDDILFGAVNPSGKLIHTIAKNESDYDSNTRITLDLDIEFTEGNYIDYKYFDKYNITPRFEFGYGLSYTTFQFSPEVTVSPRTRALAQVYAVGDLAVGGREDLWDVVATVSSTVSNTGSIAGAEVAQLYVQFPAAADEPARQLRGFDKVMIQPGATEPVTFELKRRDLSIWDVRAQSWKIERGEYVFFVGSSSRDLKARATLTV